MGNFVGFTGTDFVGTEEVGAVSSYVPCYIFGDSMLIGQGIRVGFYLLYGAAILAVLFGVDEQFRIWNTAWTIIALSTAASAFLNANPATLIVIDWAVLIQLVLWFPVFFLMQILTRKTVRPAKGHHELSDEEVRRRLQVAYNRAVTERDMAFAMAYAAVLKALAAHAAEVQAGEDYATAQANLRDTIVAYKDEFAETVNIQAGYHHHHIDENLRVQHNVTNFVLHPAHIAAIAEAPTRHDLEALRDNFIAAIFAAEGSLVVAHNAEAEVSRIVSEELEVRRRVLAPKHAVRHFLWGTAIKDKMAAALALLVWSVYMYASPNAWTVHGWLLYGQKPGCAIYFNFLFTPYSITIPTDSSGAYKTTGFTTFLLVFSCLTIPVAVVATLTAFYLIYASLVGRPPRSRGRIDEEMDQVRYVHDAPRYSHYARRKHAEEILRGIHTSDTRQAPHRYRRQSKQRMNLSLFNIPWVLVLVILFVYTAGVVEWFLRPRPAGTPPSAGAGEITFLTSNLHTTAEIMATIVGAIVLILVIWTILEGFAFLLQRKMRQSFQKKPHDHHLVKEKGKDQRDTRGEEFVADTNGGEEAPPKH